MCGAKLVDTPGNIGSRGLVYQGQRRRENFSLRNLEGGRQSLYHHMLHSSAKAVHRVPVQAWLTLIPNTEGKEYKTEVQLSDTSCAAKLHETIRCC